jgi:phytoene desaturase
MKIVVIGSGFGGLSAAIRLLAAGHEVEIIEKRDRAGGRAYVTERDGFRFDHGPTIITAPWMFDEMFALAGKKTADYVKLVKLDPFYNIRFEDGSVFRYNDDKEQLLAEIARFNPEDVKGYQAFIKQVARIYDRGMDLISQPFQKIMSMIRVLPDLIRLRSDRSVAKMAERYFKDERLRQVFSFHPLLIGGHPYQTTSVYSLIHKLEQEYGVWFAMGGTGALVDALVRLFEEMGGAIHYQQEAKAIKIDQASGRATEVETTSGQVYPLDAVVSNGDVAQTYLDLVPQINRRFNTNRRVKNKEYSMSLFVIYFGTKKRYGDIAHHEILMGPRYRGLLDDIFNHKRLADDFSLYLHRPTATDPSLAPDGCDSWYVLSPVPNLGGDIDWEQEGARYRDRILDYLEERYLPDLKENIVTSYHIDPRHFKTDLNSYLGSAFSVAPTLFQSAWFRPHNISEDIPNLYFAGAGTHPGAGVPGVISSGKIVSEIISDSCRS